MADIDSHDEFVHDVKNYLREMDNYLRQLSQLSPDEPTFFWDVQLNLLEIQDRIAAQIRNLKSERNRTKAEIAHLAAQQIDQWETEITLRQEWVKVHSNQIETLKRVLQKSRHFGDSIAWCLLRGDTKVIHPLIKNRSTGSIPEEHGLRGTKLMAIELMRAKAGIPILHDMTNILRVGDITVTDLKNDPVTVEVKTHLTKTEENKEGEVTSLQYRVEVWGEMDQVRNALGTMEDLPMVEDGPKSAFRLDSRLKRQLGRMDSARSAQFAPPGIITEVAGVPTLPIVWSPPSDAHHWNALERICKAAIRDGSSHGTLDDALFVAAIKLNEPALLQSNEEVSASIKNLYADNLANSTIFQKSQSRHPNSLWFTLSLARYDQGLGAFFTPQYAYPLDTEVLSALLWDKLALFVAINPGQIARLLEKEGLKVRYIKDDDNYSFDSMSVQQNFVAPDGQEYTSELRNIGFLAGAMMYEFLSASAFVDKILETLKSAQTVAYSEFGTDS